MRGLRTLAVRLAQHHRSGLEMARWLAARPEVARVLHPALETDPGHAIWKRDFTGASGLFSIVLKPAPQKAVDALLDTVELFGMGYSWGGFESLVIPFDCATLSHRHPMGAGRPDLAAPYRAGECRGSQGRSRTRLCGLQRGAAWLKRRIQRTAASGPIPTLASHLSRRFANVGIKGPLAKLKWLVEFWI